MPDDEARVILNERDKETIRERIDDLRLEPSPERRSPDPPVVGPSLFAQTLRYAAERQEAQRETDETRAAADAAFKAVEAQRDAAVARAEALARERDDALAERDAAVARADELTRERDAAVARTEDRAERTEPPERPRRRRGGRATGDANAKRPRP